MFDDTKKELQRLSRQLLEEETVPEAEEAEELSYDEWLDREIAQAKAMLDDVPEKEPEVVRNYANEYGKNIPQPRAAIVETEYYSDELKEEAPVKEKGVGGLVALAWLLTAGIVAVAAYWVLVLF